MNATGGDEGTVTVVFTWDVRPGREREFERWASGINQAGTRWPGHLGATWLRSEGARYRYYTVLNFTDRERLDAWLDSDERAGWLDRLDGIAKGHRHHTTGLETWFSLPGESVPAPPRWKMVIVTFCAVYPMSLLIQLVVVPPTRPWPVALKAVTFPLLLVPVLTYVLMPLLSRALRRWLYPQGRDLPPASPQERDVP
ncbi:antibiotic biosynthesis monooxygenase [Actinomadura sp. 21ATH]|uniref:antibiotic biosynthesis monooxygenase n=1 Tax=Actinomadura sp. 21ATH TaxID=1735444 RepID=UPI0035BFF8A7